MKILRKNNKNPGNLSDIQMHFLVVVKIKSEINARTDKSAHHNKVQKKYQYISEPIDDQSDIFNYWEIGILLNK